jgi:hypothetical protein
LLKIKNKRVVADEQEKNYFWRLKKKRLTIVVAIGDEKREDQLLMGSTKRKQQLFGMIKGKSNYCYWGSIRGEK